MRKLTPFEEQVLGALKAKGSICPGSGGPRGLSENGQRVVDALNALVRRKLAYAEPTDDGPRYHAA